MKTKKLNDWIISIWQKRVLPTNQISIKRAIWIKKKRKYIKNKRQTESTLNNFYTWFSQISIQWSNRLIYPAFAWVLPIVTYIIYKKYQTKSQYNLKSNSMYKKLSHTHHITIILSILLYSVWKSSHREKRKKNYA